MTISFFTIIAGAVVVILAILGSLINPFLRSLRFPEQEFPVEDSSDNAADESAENNVGSSTTTTYKSWSATSRCSSVSSTLPNIRSSLFAKAPMESPKII